MRICDVFMIGKVRKKVLTVWSVYIGDSWTSDHIKN